MNILSIGATIEDHRFTITNYSFSELSTLKNLHTYDYILISGGDGLIRRVIQTLFANNHTFPPFILNPIGSFNVISKVNRTPSYTKVLDALANKKSIVLKKQSFYGLNDEIFLFSAGNMGDLQHIFLSETLRFGILKKGIGKYAVALFFLLPLHLVMTPFMLLSSKRFFIFMPLKFMPSFSNFYSHISKEIIIDLQNEHNLIELDGDVVTIQDSLLHINPKGTINIVTL